MALSQAEIDAIIALWDYNEQQADPRSQEEDIVSGLRQTELLSCQYWIKGLSAVCSNWSDDGDGSCVYEIPEDGESPSGYNGGKCDHLGRRATCSKYEASDDEDIEEYKCIVPNMFLSGIGKASGDANVGLTLTPIPKADIKGYCAGDCDGAGRGTGCGGTPGTSPIICNYFRPWQMGFGSLEPRDVRRTIDKDGNIHITAEDLQDAYDAIHTQMEFRLPLSFKIYNLRSEFQKCAYWDADEGASFSNDSFEHEGVNYAFIEIDADPEATCICTDLLARQHCTIADPPPPEDVNAWLLQEVWSEANTVVCNGAKPECPFYTGEWTYCNDANMLVGMRVTANQIFELRFWTALWGSQEEYDSFFESKPNWQDVPTADIYTFTKWHKKGITAADSVALGQILHMCQPAPLNNRRFVPSTFLEATNIEYTAAGINMGTTAPSQGQVYYPTLIRDPELRTDIWPIDIIYPYADLDPFSAEVCDAESQKEPLGIKRGSSIDGDTVSVVGTTIRSHTVYTFNLNMLDYTLSEFNFNWNISTISNVKTATSEDEGTDTGLSPREKFFQKLDVFIERLQKENPNELATTISDNETGYFKAGPLNLKYGEHNRIVVCIKFTDTDWDFRIRPTLAKLYGGLIIQNSFDQSGTGENLPNRFTPNANITATAHPILDNAGAVPGTTQPSCDLSSIIHTASNEYVNTELSIASTYSYCYKKVTINNDTIYNWANIGNSGLVWADLEDTNISYLFEWGVISAKMIYAITELGADPIEVAMSNVEIETFVSGKRSVPPSACILEPTDTSVKKMFLSGDWNLEMSYWYKEISNTDDTADNIEILWPDFSDPTTYFDESTLGIELVSNPNRIETEIIISDVDNQTLALMGLFADEDGRVIAAMATKLLVQVALPECRNVEIDYRYSQPATWYKLLPETNISRLAIPPTSERFQGEYSPRYFRPWCGDHKNGSQGSGKGAMWYPFDDCDPCDFYQAFAGASYCTNWFPCGGSYGSYDTSSESAALRELRFCGPTKYTAFVAPGGGSAYADCVLYFHYRYSVVTGNAFFAGYANTVAYVNSLEYIGYKWAMPPFGNKGREMTSKWLSQDNWAHLTYKDTARPYVKSQWVPMVPDSTDFFMSFNAYDEQSVISPDDFMHVNQLSFFKSDLLDETVVTERKGFDEVFGSRGIWRSTYPPPVVTEGMIQKTIHYYFKDSDTAWAWREYWKAIEYTDTRSLYFLTYERPEYEYSYEKQEHSYICDEGEYTVTYTAPVIEEGEMTEYPSLKLGDGPKRFFKIIYDTYGAEELVEWADEGSGKVDGSREEGEEQNIYEVTSPNTPRSKWTHDENCLFDDTAVRTYVDAEAAGQSIKMIDDMDEIIEYYYNRGVIVNLSRDILEFLPYEEEVSEESFTIAPDSNDGLGFGSYSWYGTDPVITVDLTTVLVGTCLSEVTIEGLWGLHVMDFEGVRTERSVCVPGVTVVENYGDGESRTLVTKEKVNFDKDIYGDIGLVSYTLTFDLAPTVDRMLTKRGTSIEITLECDYTQYLYLNSAEFKIASYCNSTETIQVYERKYITSTSSNFGDHNIDGPKVGSNFVLQYELELDNSGTYYAISPIFSYVSTGDIIARDKMRGMYAGSQYYDDESIVIDINNISEIETTNQKELYNSAIKWDVDGDTTNYTFVLPPSLEYFSENNNVEISISDTLVITAQKSTWEGHYLQNSYTAGEMWYPQGHKYQWSEKMKRMRCYEYAYGSTAFVLQQYNIMDVVFLHMDTTTTDITSDPLTALYSNRMSYQIGVGEKLYGSDVAFENAGHILGTASSFIDDSNVTLM